MADAASARGATATERAWARYGTCRLRQMRRRRLNFFTRRSMENGTLPVTRTSGSSPSHGQWPQSGSQHCATAGQRTKSASGQSRTTTGRPGHCAVHEARPGHASFGRPSRPTCGGEEATTHTLADCRLEVRLGWRHRLCTSTCRRLCHSVRSKTPKADRDGSAAPHAGSVAARRAVWLSGSTKKKGLRDEDAGVAGFM
eukprot:scaffold104454_cov75-Phaeocystis_antarctica.AAC.3